MEKDTIKLNVSQVFYDWWQKQLYCNDQSLLYVAWAAWSACEVEYNKSLEPTDDVYSLTEKSE